MTARESLAVEIRRSHLIATQDARERRLRRKAQRRAHLVPVLMGLALALCFVVGLWGSTP
jgi:hypothetical protein